MCKGRRGPHVAFGGITGVSKPEFDERRPQLGQVLLETWALSPATAVPAAPGPWRGQPFGSRAHLIETSLPSCAKPEVTAAERGCFWHPETDDIVLVGNLCWVRARTAPCSNSTGGPDVPFWVPSPAPRLQSLTHRLMKRALLASGKRRQKTRTCLQRCVELSQAGNGEQQPPEPQT